MAANTSNRNRSLLAMGLVFLLALLGVLLRHSESPLGDGLVRKSYDVLQQWRGAPADGLHDSPVVIVYLDLNSFNLLNQDPTAPWSRQLHAELLRKLTAAQAKAVVFDIVFSAPGADPAGDDALAAAMRENGRTILAGEASVKISHATTGNSEWVHASTIDPPWERFVAAAAGWGVASHIVDDDYGVRRYVAGGFGPEQQPSLTWSVAQMLRLPIAAEPNAMVRANGRHLRYYGPPLAIPHVSYAEALSTNGVPQNFFRNKIVFIGARPLTEFFRGRQDEFRSPFHSWGNKELFTPGVEVHATEMLNLVRGDFLQRSSVAAELLGILLVAALGAGLLLLRPVSGAVVACCGAVIIALTAVVAFGQGGWVPWLIPVGVQIPVALGGSILFHSLEWYRARRRFEARIHEQAALIDKAHDAILVQSLDGQVIYANPSAVRLYGWSGEELQHSGALEQLFGADAEVAAKARQVAQASGEWNGELRQQTKAGRVVIVASRWTLIRDERGAPQQLLIINSDITEQKELEAQFLRTQRMNTIGTLAGGMAHDLNNALAPILMGAQLLRRKSSDAETRNLLSLMESNTQRGADMVRQVLLFARGRGGEFERLEIAPLVRELEKMIRETFPKNIAVETFLPKDLWPVRGNPTQLHQVLLNLCVNARDAMPNGGKLSFVADNVELSEAEAAQIPEGRAGRFVSVSVTDAGTGIPPEVLAKIFEPFFTTKGEGRGTGIGLATVLRLIKAHHGFLQVESEVGSGTTFEVFLPQAEATAAVSVAEIPADLPRGNGELLLVADDELAIRELMKSELSAFGYRVLVAADGAEAVALFEQHSSEVKLLITDNAMPVLSGREAIAQVRHRQPTLPVIYMSADAGDEAIAGVTVLSKPFALEELLKAIRDALVK
jgi:two-component system cell cycle sensor histidine kinase/response regulator CckA